MAADDASYIVDLRAHAGAFLNRGATTIAQQLSWLGAYFERAGDFCFVVETLDGRRQGLVGLYDLQWPRRTAEWGRWVLTRGSSAAVESALLIYRFAFDELALELVRCRTLGANAKVVAFHDSCGLARAPTELVIDRDGEPRPAIEHVLSRAEWPRVMARLDRVASRFATTISRSSAGELLRHDT